MSLHLVEKQVVYDGKRVRLEIHHLETEDGRRVQKEVGIHPGAVVILPFIDADTILMIRNRRYTDRANASRVARRWVGSRRDPDERRGRELVEETGHLAGRLVRLLDFYSSPGILSEKMYTFAAYDLEKVEQDLEDDEEIEVLSVPFEDAIGMIRDRQIVDAKSIATLLSYDRFFRGQ